MAAPAGVKILSEAVREVDCAGNIVVVKALTGMGSAAGAALDHLHLPEVVGSVAGDDTVLIVVRSAEAAEARDHLLRCSIDRRRLWRGMLKFLHIENIAVIKRLDLSLGERLQRLYRPDRRGQEHHPRLAAAALRRARSDRDLIRTGEQRALVEGVFDVGEAAFPALAEYGVEPEDGELFLTCTLTADGRSGARINARPVPLSVLRAVAADLSPSTASRTRSPSARRPNSLPCSTDTPPMRPSAPPTTARRDYIEKAALGCAAQARGQRRARRDSRLPVGRADRRRREEGRGRTRCSRNAAGWSTPRRSRCWPTPPTTRSPAPPPRPELSASAADALEKLAAYLPAVQPLAERVKKRDVTSWRTSPNRCAITAKPRSRARGSTGSSSACPTSRGCAKNTAPTPTACPRYWRKSTARSRNRTF